MGEKEPAPGGVKTVEEEDADEADEIGIGVHDYDEG